MRQEVFYWGGWLVGSRRYENFSFFRRKSPQEIGDFLLFQRFPLYIIWNIQTIILMLKNPL